MRDLIKTFSPYYVLALFAAIAFGIFAAISMPKAYAAGEGEKLIMIHDRDQEQGVITRAGTLRDAFEDAGIKLDDNDRVEPGLDEPLVANQYQVNIYRARPVVIVDGPVRQLVMSAYQTPKQIAKHAGIELRDEDTAAVDVSNNFVGDGASIRMNVDRATPIQLTLYGKTETVYTQTETVSDFLEEKNITLGKDDDMSNKAESSITANMQLSIWRNGKQTMTQEENVPFDTEKIQDANRDLGFKQVDTPGVNGKKMVTYEIIMQNGVEVSRVAIQTVVTKQPAKQVETVGAKVKTFGGNCASWMQAAGITDMANATYLINAESGCNPNSVNKSSGACGVGQALPCSKTGCEMGDGACQTAWMNRYVLGRYGSWEAAANHHRNRGWY